MPKPGYDLPTGKRAAPGTTIICATGKTLHFGTETHPMAHSPSAMASTAGGLYKSTRLVSCDIVGHTCKPFSEPLNSETEDAGIVVANTQNTY